MVYEHGGRRVIVRSRRNLQLPERRPALEAKNRSIRIRPESYWRVYRMGCECVRFNGCGVVCTTKREPTFLSQSLRESPHYYLMAKMVFASEIKAILAHHSQTCETRGGRLSVKGEAQELECSSKTSWDARRRTTPFSISAEALTLESIMNPPRQPPRTPTNFALR